MANAQDAHPPSSIFHFRPIFIAGPTAVGKSGIALRLAEQIGGEIISADSMQVYRGLDIGTAKPSPAERARVPHHLIDVCDLTEHFDAAQFIRLAQQAVDKNSVTRTRAGFLRRHRTLFQGVLERPRRSARHRSRIARRTGSRAIRGVAARTARMRPGGLRKD